MNDYSKSPFKNMTTELEQMFTDGFCYVLAVELAKHFDLEVYSCDEHAVVKTKTGKYLDILGTYRTLKDLDNWNGRWVKVPADYSSFPDWDITGECSQGMSLQKAKRLAKRLIKSGIKEKFMRHFVSKKELKQVLQAA